MASISSRISLFLVIFLAASSLLIQATLGEFVCEDLPRDVCAFSISSSGKRCVLEYHVMKRGKMEYQCKTSEVVVDSMSEYIETDSCVEACGANRGMVGISSDALLDPRFTAKLCSSACSQDCPNIVDLYFNLAAGEGVSLPDLCEKQRSNPRRAMAEILSSGAASGATSDDKFVPPAPSPAFL